MIRHTTQTRSRIEAYIGCFWDEYKYAPTVAEIAHALHLIDKDIVRYHLRGLRKEGVIHWVEGSGRTIRMANCCQ